MEKVNLRTGSNEIVHNLGEDVMSHCSSQDKDGIQQKLDQITNDFATVRDKVTQKLEYLEIEKAKAEAYEKHLSDLDDWLKGKESIVEQLEEFVIDSTPLKQQVEEIKVLITTVQ